MSCNCNGCGQPERLCRCPKGKGEAPKRAYIAECTDCDPCRPCESMVKICSFVTPTLTEGQKFRNSFVYNQEDDSVYYISDDGTPTRFGSSPMFINAFNPDDRKIPRQTVFDFANQKAYIYDPEGNYITVNLAGGGAGGSELHLEWTSSTGWTDAGETNYNTHTLRTSQATFTNVDTSETMTIEEVYNALAAGTKIVFDNIPFGMNADIYDFDYPIVKGVSVSNRQNIEDGDGAVVDSFTGVESVTFLYAGSEQGIGTIHTMPLSFDITKVTMEGAPTPLYLFEVQSYWSGLL